MLRINLLPAYIAEQKKKKANLVWAFLLPAVCIAAPLIYRFVPQEQAYNDIKAKADQADTDATAVETTESNTTAKLSEIQPLQAKVDFVKDIQFYNRFPGLVYKNVARYTYRGVEYNSMAVQGDSLSVNAFVPKLEDVGRFYLTLFGNPDIKALSIKGMPNWQTMQAMKQMPPDAQRGFPIQVAAQLVHSVNPPVPPAGGAAGGGMGAGMSGMMSGSMPPGAMMGGGGGGGIPGGAGKSGMMDQ
jgi:hypothetical protein